MSDIVYVDDDPDAFMAHANAEQAKRIFPIRFDQANPDDVAESPKGTTVWLFDFFLMTQSSSSPRSDENGLSLSQKWKATTGTRPTTVLVSSDIEKAVGEPMGPLERRHVIAQRQGVEWIGDKSQTHAEETLRQVVELADAATLVTNVLKPVVLEGELFGAYDAEDLCFAVLMAPKESDWANSAQRQIDRARPPRELPLLNAATARPIVSWLVAHVLPYPSFLLSDAQAALRLGITAASFRNLVAVGDDGDANRKSLADCEYVGPLARFQGRRWWRAGIDETAWKLSSGKQGLQSELARLASPSVLAWLNQPEPVLLSDADLVETDEVAAAADCVRVTEEDFPASVDPAWVRLTDAKADRQLAAKVVYEDRPLLEADE